MKIYKFFELIFYQLTKVKWNYTETKEWNIFFSSCILTLLIWANLFSIDLILLKLLKPPLIIGELLYLTILTLIMLIIFFVFGRYSRYKKIIVKYQDGNNKKNKHIFILYLIITIIFVVIGVMCRLSMPTNLADAGL